MKPEHFAGPASPVTDADVRAAASLLKVTPAHVRAVEEVESRGRGFHPDTRRPVILYEPHVFSRETKGKFDQSHPSISYPKWGEEPYPAAQAQRYAQLFAAMALDEAAALKSASWGKFQIMGFNYKASGFKTVQEFVAAMVKSEGEQLAAFARFVAANPSMAEALRLGDWAGFARRYNGPSFASHGYDQRLKSAYAKYRAGLGDKK